MIDHKKVSATFADLCRVHLGEWSACSWPVKLIQAIVMGINQAAREAAPAPVINLDPREQLIDNMRAAYALLQEQHKVMTAKADQAARDRDAACDDSNKARQLVIDEWVRMHEEIRKALGCLTLKSGTLGVHKHMLDTIALLKKKGQHLDTLLKTIDAAHEAE